MLTMVMVIGGLIELWCVHSIMAHQADMQGGRDGALVVKEVI